MAKRKGLPKPSASERTLSRYRIRHNMETKEDEKRLSIIQEVKERLVPPGLKKLMEKMTPEEREKMMVRRG